MKALRDIYQLNVNEPFKQLFTQGMITHKTYRTKNNEWVLPKDVALDDVGNLVRINTKENVIEGAVEKMSKSKKNVVEPNEILENYGIDATRIFMISDSPPDRELEWTDDGIQSSKNLINRINRYFANNASTNITSEIEKMVEKFANQVELNILNFSLNKCVASIYTLLNYLEKNKVYLHNNELSRKILICLFPIVPRLSKKIYLELFNQEINQQKWPDIDQSLLTESEIELPIQVNGKLVTTMKTIIDYNEEEQLALIYKNEKIKKRIEEKSIKKVINVKNKIINIIVN